MDVIRLPESLSTRGTPAFEAVFRREVAALGPDRRTVRPAASHGLKWVA